MCNGSNLNATVGNAHGTNNGCGVTQNSNVSTVSDAYSGFASLIPADTCGSYPQEPTKVHDPARFFLAVLVVYLGCAAAA